LKLRKGELARRMWATEERKTTAMKEKRQQSW
jgi:hypothetical protein